MDKHKHAPLRKRTRKERKLLNIPWITKGILVSSKTKNILHLASLKGNPESSSLYKRYRNVLVHAKEQAKKNCYSHLIDDSKHNVRLL